MPNRVKRKQYTPPSYVLETVRRHSGIFPLKNVKSHSRDYDNLWDLESREYRKVSELSEDEIKRIKTELHYYAIKVGFREKDSQDLALSWK